MIRFVLIVLLTFCSSGVFAQELFPLNEPASSIPKGVLGIRVQTEDYKENSPPPSKNYVIRNLFTLRAMYGVTSKLSLYISGSESNHHSADFPPNLASHTHTATGTVYNTGNYVYGVPYAYKFVGIDLFAKYRFLTLDGHKQHLRMALYAEGSNVNVAHDETEPTLLDDTKGLGGGLITTYLKNHFAVSLTVGGIIPGAYNGLSPDTAGGPMVPTYIKYGKALRYDLSFGYLLFPHQYKNYNQSSLSIYVEFEGKAYQQAVVTQYGGVSGDIPVTSPLLKAGNYVEVYPGVQWIYKSNLRVELSAGFPFINKSYVRFYPVFQLGIQRYFFLSNLKKKSKTPPDEKS